MTGPVIAIGGNEDKHGRCEILRAVATHAHAGPLVVLTAASNVPDRRWADYSAAFARLGVHDVRHLDIRDRSHAHAPNALAVLQRAAAVFITGGDQFRLLARVANTPVHHRIAMLHAEGALVAGTSAGASVCGEVVIGGSWTTQANTFSRPTESGFGLLAGCIVEQHCGQRNRLGRLHIALRRHPQTLGVGLDEDTAVIHDGSGRIRAIGSGEVHVVWDAPTARGIVLRHGEELDLTPHRASIDERYGVLRSDLRVG